MLKVWQENQQKHKYLRLVEMSNGDINLYVTDETGTLPDNGMLLRFSETDDGKLQCQALGNVDGKLVQTMRNGRMHIGNYI